MKHLLARDAFESVKLMPTSSPLWQRLCELVDDMAIEQKPRLIDEIASLHLLRNDSNWLRYGALAYLTRDPDCFSQQAACADSETPPDAIMNLLGLVWYHALARAPESQAFVQLLRDSNAPGLQRLVAKRLPALMKARPRIGMGLRVAIYTPQIMNNRHGGTTFTINMMSVAALIGMECRTFTAQEVNIPVANAHCGAPELLTQSVAETDSLVLHASVNVQMVLPNVGFSLRLRFEQMLEAVHAYKPDLIIFVGFISPLVYRLYESYPVVGLSLHALPPVAPVDVWLSADPHGDATLWPDITAPQNFHYPFRFWPKGQAVPMDRAQLGIPVSNVILITTGHRLNTEMPQAWLDRMLAFTNAHPDVHWLLVGLPQGHMVAGLPEHPRIHSVEPQTELDSWLATCDIYINPPRVGGGSTVAMAMEQGLAVLTLADGDGGDKVGDWAVASQDDYFVQLSIWVGNPTARKQVGEALKKQFHARLDVSSTPAQEGLVQACHAAIKSFNLRTEAVNA